jgi:predicted ATP-dependent endonuclease of OLD family
VEPYLVCPVAGDEFMRIGALRIRNFRALKETPLLTLSQMPVIIGRNDAGKSSILHAIDVFFDQRTMSSSDLHSEAGQQDSVEIEVAFMEIEEEVRSQLQHKRLISSNSCLVIKKIYDRSPKLKSILINAYDFTDPDFQNLCSKKEKDLNEVGRRHNLTFTPAGRSITNESKIDQLVDYAQSQHVRMDDVWIEPDKDVLKELLACLPKFTLFPSELSLTTEQSQFQNPFQQMIAEAIGLDQSTKEGFEQKVEQAVLDAMRAIETNLKEQTDSVTHLIPMPEFQWKKLVSLDIETEDRFGTRVPISSRGLGVRRLLMVAFLKFVADKEAVTPKIYAIEEPETYLHPKAQRDLVEAFRKLKARSSQVIITSHSPVFAAEATQEDIVLVCRDACHADVTQGEAVSPESIVEELGILPRDSVVGYAACVFVEGPGDQFFFETVSRKLHEAGRIRADFRTAGIGVVPVGGNNLKFFVEKELILKRLNCRFGVVVDSDKTCEGDQVSQKVLRWKQTCEHEGGKFFILRKRAIENYLHPSAILRTLGRSVVVEDFNNVKQLLSTDPDWQKHLKPVVEAMSLEEILQMQKYSDGGSEKDEFLEMFDNLLRLTED